MGRESAFPELYEERQEKILDLLLQLDSDVVCLQEFFFFLILVVNRVVNTIVQE
jgi:hypothetical protein